ncbi:hypothetical protein AVEN_217126-1 [Araneus ventricosus]|uniref:Uncharacterized protein n=1 Tax=Araneus ventricosus TaxID=182803 RepID=A0A4Y2E958_ARAVE|nr:hypothetical protein AVEN_217126-1 [Araneus ventricosus]
MKRTTPELATPSPNFRTQHLRGSRSTHVRFTVHQAHKYGVSSGESGFEPGVLRGREIRTSLGHCDLRIRLDLTGSSTDGLSFRQMLKLQLLDFQKQDGVPTTKLLSLCLSALRRLSMPLRECAMLRKRSKPEEQLEHCCLQCVISRFCVYGIMS